MSDGQPTIPSTNVQEVDLRLVVQVWDEAYASGQLLSALRVYWRDFVPMLCRPSLVSESKNDETRERKIQKYLFGPLERFLCDGDPNEVFTYLKAKDKPSQICGHVFKGGEPTYSCRQCAMDPTCVFCINCFEASVHKNHKYRMNASSGGGYCDCGDVEAWKSDPFCDHHKVGSACGEENSNPILDLPPSMRAKGEVIFNGFLRHTLELLVWTQDDKLPEGMHVEELNDEFTTMLFNDEVHTYEQVISTLKRAVHCSQKEAVDFATTVDREGRSCVLIGKYSDCEKAKGVIEKSTSRLGSKPLKVQVLHMSVVSQQMFAVRIVQWLQKLISSSDGLRELFCEVSMKPLENENGISFLEEFLKIDTSLWKAARIICHQTIMSAILPSLQYKQKFAILFTRLYNVISADYIKDDHDHSVCVVSESVQLFTVPSLARMLIKDYNLLYIILSSFVEVCEMKKKQNGRFAFDRSERSQGFRRAQYMLHDVKYALSIAPKPSEWNDDLRNNFLNGFKELLHLLSYMQGMDAVTRQTGQHIEFEPEWEGAFNLQVRLDDTLTLFIQWCESDGEVLKQAYCLVLEALRQCRDPKYKLESMKVAGHEARVVRYDVSSQPVSIHLPLSRLLAGLHLSLARYGVTFSDLCSMPVKSIDFSAVDLFEHALRVQVMIAQTHAGMWRRNGFSLLNQIYFYSNVKCRREMYDRDIVLLQAGGALLDPNEFLIHLVNKFGLALLMKEGYDKPSSSSEDLVRQVVIMSEELLNLMIIIVSERFDPCIGIVDPGDAMKREVVHQLCIHPMAHSELAKALPDDPNETTDIDGLIEEIAKCKDTGGSGKKMFELKPEFYDIYNPYFYHYHRSDQTKSEEQQRKRKKTAGGDQSLPPPLPPKFRPAFESLVNLLFCDVMVYIMKLILKRSVAQRSRSWTEAQLERVLHLIGLALYEDERYGEERNFPFVSKTTGRDGLLSLLESLVGHENVAHGSQRDLLNWVINRFHHVMKSKDASANPGKAIVDNSANDEKAAKEREKKAKLAEKRRKQLLEQMSKMQKNFILENAELFENTDSDLNSGSGDMEVHMPSDQFPVCVGPDRSDLVQSGPLRSTCILCQEQQEVTLNGRAMVLATFSQRSTVLSRRRGTSPAPNSDLLFVSEDLLCGIYTSTCGHIMHADCWQRFFDSIVNQERRRMFRFRPYPSFDIDKMEFLCPLCETISNSVMPLIPTRLSTNRPVVPDRHVDMNLDEWCYAMHKASVSSIREALDDDFKELDESLSPCTLSNLVRQVDKKTAFGITTLYECVEEPENELSDNIKDMIRKMTKDVCSVSIAPQAGGEIKLTPMFVWQTCAFTIEIIERSLTDEEKPLFGALSSRQNDCLSALVKLTSAIGHLEPQSVKAPCVRILRLFLPDPEFADESACLLDTDLFHQLVSLVSSLPLLFTETDKPGLSNIACGNLSDLFTVQLALAVRIIQIMMKTDLASVESDDDNAMDTDDSANSYSELYEVYRTVRGSSEELCSPARLQSAIEMQILPFLRCTALFYHFLTDIQPPDEMFGIHQGQTSILLRYLGLSQDLSQIFLNSEIRCRIQSWSHGIRSEKPAPAMFSTPSLIALPNDYSQLINSLSQFTCPNSDGDDSRAPTMCLVCGKLLCSQSYCCQMELNGQMVGAATHHAHLCGAGTGIFLRVRECQVLLLASKTKGCFLPAPYLDKYGEADQLLRRGNPLFLSMDRYKKLRKLWLSHGIPEEIAHQLESNTNLMNFEWHNL